MKIINKIKAFFNLNGVEQEMELSGADVKKKGVFLHPLNDPNHIFFVKSKTVDIIINRDAEICEDDIIIIDKENVKKNRLLDDANFDKNNSDKRSNSRSPSYTRFMPLKKRFSVMLYQDEYDTLIKNITDYGYKKAEFFLACVKAAKKQSFDATYKKYTDEHKKRYKADLAEAKKAQADIELSKNNS